MNRLTLLSLAVACAVIGIVILVEESNKPSAAYSPPEVYVPPACATQAAVTPEVPVAPSARRRAAQSVQAMRDTFIEAVQSGGGSDMSQRITAKANAAMHRVKNGKKGTDRAIDYTNEAFAAYSIAANKGFNQCTNADWIEVLSLACVYAIEDGDTDAEDLLRWSIIRRCVQ